MIPLTACFFATRGAKLCVVKTRSKIQQSEIMIATNIFTRESSLLAIIVFLRINLSEALCL